jgi:hypothetical protein
MSVGEGIEGTRIVLTEVTNVISQIQNGISQVKVNTVKVGYLRAKTASIEGRVKGFVEKIRENEWCLSEEDVKTLMDDSNFIKEMLSVLNARIIKKIKPRKIKWFMGKSHKALLDLAEEVLKEVDAKADVIKKELEERLLSARFCSKPRSTTYTGSTNRRCAARPHPVDSLQVSLSGAHMDIKWNDSANSPKNLTGYSVVVNNREVEFVTPTNESNDHSKSTDCINSADHTESTDSNSSAEYSMSVQLRPWHTYRIEVYAENSRGQSDQACQVVRMNQHAPTVKPTIDVKDINALSKSSVRVSVPIPQGSTQETVISDCKVLVFENNSENLLVLKEVNSVFRRGEIWVQVGGLNSTAQHTIYAMFCNRHGDGPMSNPVEFKIASLEPSEPLLGIESFTDRSIKLRWRVKKNAGSVQRYLLFEGPEKTYKLSTKELCHEIKGLTPNKRYSFSVAAEFQKAGETHCTRKESILMPCLTYLL